LKPNKPKRRGARVRASILAGFALFIAIAIGALWLLQVVFFERIYKTFKISELVDRATALAALADDSDRLAEKAVETAEKYNLCIACMLPEQNVFSRLTDVSYADCNLYDLRPMECYTLYTSAVENGGSQLMSVFYDRSMGYAAREYSLYSSDDHPSVIYTLITEKSDGDTFVLFVNSAIAPVGATVNTITAILIIVTVILVILAVVLVMLMSRLIAKPIVDINDKAKKFAEGDYSVRFNGGGYREINELSDTLNYAGEELSKVDKLRKELISNISHDLRTPLTLIRGYSEAMRDLPGEFTPENIQTVIDETDRLSSIVSEMLEYSKLESGNYSPNFEILDLCDILDSAVRTYRALIEKNGYRIDYSPGGSAPVRVDRNMIVRALFNLINNAVTHTGSDYTVSVRCITSAAAVRVEVADTGAGIPHEQLDLIWERYYKADTVHKRAAMGTGLGLSIVKSIVSLHDGICGVQSTLGQGSTFWIELPLAPAEQ